MLFTADKNEAEASPGKSNGEKITHAHLPVNGAKKTLNGKTNASAWIVFPVHRIRSKASVAEIIMSEILVYVNEALSCSVFCDDEDMTVESFRKNILNEQVDDILNFPFKFTRLVNTKRLVVGVKQEAVIKTVKCIDATTDDKAIYLVREELIKPTEQSTTATNSNTEKDKADVEEPTVSTDNTEKGDNGEPPSKQRKISRQPTILDFTTGQPHKNKVTKSDPYSAARARKVKVFTESEIEVSTGLRKVYRRFWNDKAEEICSSRSLNKFKPGEIQGAINVAWTLEKTRHLKEEMEKVNMESGQQCQSKAVLRKLQTSAKTIDKNSLRVENAHETLSKTQKELTNARFELFQSANSCQHKNALEKIEKQEKDLEANLTELRKAQDALRKSLDVKRKLLNSMDAAESEKEGEFSSDGEGEG